MDHEPHLVNCSASTGVGVLKIGDWGRRIASSSSRAAKASVAAPWFASAPPHQSKWVVQGAVDVDIGANPSAEGAGDDEGVDDQAVKVVDIVDTFRLQEQPAFDKKQFLTYMKRYIKNLSAKLEGEELDAFKKNIEAATKMVLGKLKDLHFFVGESMHDDGSLVFAYYKNGATDPTFLYFVHGLKEVKC